MNNPTKPSAAILFTRDLMFSSRVRGSAADHGIRLLVADNTAQVERIVEKNVVPLLMIDLDLIADDVANTIKSLRNALPDTEMVGYAGHVKETLLQQASDTGQVSLMTRGQFNQQHGELLQRFMPVKSD